VLPLCHTIGYQAADEFPELTVTLDAVDAELAVAALPEILILHVPDALAPVVEGAPIVL